MANTNLDFDIQFFEFDDLHSHFSLPFSGLILHKKIVTTYPITFYCTHQPFCNHLYVIAASYFFFCVKSLSV